LRVANSGFGRSLKAIREDERAASSIGKDVGSYKVRTFVFSSALAGLAGCMYASYVGFISPESFDVDVSIAILAVVVLGGMANVWGSVIGAIVLVALPQLISFLPLNIPDVGAVQQVIYGLALILFMIFRPQGIYGEQAGMSARSRRANS
jgi:branched-chain amino acid transport system permease protein